MVVTQNVRVVVMRGKPQEVEEKFEYITREFKSIQ